MSLLRGGTPADSSIKETTVVQGLTATTALAWAPDGSNRLFVARKNGEIRIVKNGSLLSTPFATVSPIYTSSECGLLGICFDPNFVSNGYVYVFATVSSSEQQIIRYKASGDVGGSKTVLIPRLPTRGANHDGGKISIGPDGKLYWAIGDLGNYTGVDADLSTLASKVGRANLDGTPANDNPYYSSSDGIGPRDYIWARGFRNPFKHAWHKATGKMWVNVVGDRYEQVFAISRGGHGGWNDYEGGNQPSGYSKPVIQYVTNGGVGGCITGGTFYYGTAYPSQYQGNYFYCDYNSQKILRATVDSSGNVTSVNNVFVSSAGSLTDICEGPDGALYYVNYGGDIKRLAYASSSQSLIVSTTSLSVNEANRATFTVRLAVAPSSTVTVNVTRSSGDSDVTVSTGASLSFTSSNYSTPQTVTIAAASDADTTDDTAVISVSASGLSTKTVSVAVKDDDTQSFILSASSLNIRESGSGTFSVRLANQPSSTVTVAVGRSSGDTDVNVSSGTSLSFTSSNYATPQNVTVSAASDSDTSNDSAVVSVSASGVSTRTVSVAVTDDDNSAPLITTTPVTSAIVGVGYRYDVHATGLPAPVYSLTSGPSGMTISSSTGLISWTPAGTGTFSVTVQASNGVSPSAAQSFSITVAADRPPVATITRPASGATVSGKTAEWYGDGSDDGGTVKAEFYVDGVLKYTDTNTSGHYHFGGTHNVWDTTMLSNGSHVLKMVVYDAKGQAGSKEVTVTVSNSSSGSGLTAPANFSAKVGSTSVTLSWSSVSGANGYKVKRKKVLTDPFSVVATTASTSLTETGLVTGRTYYYVVSAFNSTAESPDSAMLTVVPGSGSTTTSTPTLVIPSAPSSLTATAASASAINLRWTDNSSNESGFKIERKTGSSGTYALVTTLSAGATSYSNTGLSAGAVYYYRVRAYNSAGDSPFSNEASATTSSSTATPTSPSSSTLAAYPGDAKALLKWSAFSGATSYNLKRSKIAGGPHSTIVSTSNTSFTDTGLVNGRIYYYVVSAVTSSGETANSAEVSVTPNVGLVLPSSLDEPVYNPTNPPASEPVPTDSTVDLSEPTDSSVPTGLSADVGPTSVDLSWNVFAGATGYSVKRSKTNGGPYSTIKTVTSPSAFDSGLVTGRTYYYVVSALTASGETGNSSQLAVTPGQADTTVTAAFFSVDDLLGLGLGGVQNDDVGTVATADGVHLVIRQLNDGRIEIDAHGPFAGEVSIESSSDLRHWRKLKTVELGGAPVTIYDQAESDRPRFYRAVRYE